jgi:LEA14-like dessication related protein
MQRPSCFWNLTPYLAVLLLLAACTQVTRETVAPQVSLTSLQILQLGLLEQRYRIGLRMQNPNDHPINIRGLEFAVQINGQDFASGVSDEGALLPELGEAVLNIDATSTLSAVLGQLSELQKTQTLDYQLSGKLRLDNLVVPIPFEHSGRVPLQLPTPTAPTKAPTPDSI